MFKCLASHYTSVTVADYVSTNHQYISKYLWLCKTRLLSSANEIVHEECGQPLSCDTVLGDFRHTLLV